RVVGGEGAEAVDLQFGEFVAHATVQGQAVGGAQFGLGERGHIAEHGFRYPFAVGGDQHLARGVLQDVDAAGELEVPVEQAVATEAELAAELVRLVLRLVEQRSDRGDGGILEAAQDATAVAGTKALAEQDRKSTRLNSSHVKISYAVFCLKKK